MENSNTYVYIGRFQIPHLGHEAVMEHAIKSSNEVIILIGSANSIRDSKNPFTYEERKEILTNITNRLCKQYNPQANVIILPLNDFNDDNRWTAEVYDLIYSHTKNKNITITGCQKSGDVSTFYLDLFPDWKQDFIREVKISGFDVISSTKIRELYFNNQEIPQVISLDTLHFLDCFKVKNLHIFNSFNN